MNYGDILFSMQTNERVVQKSSFKFDKWMRSNSEMMGSNYGIQFHEWLMPSEWSRLCCLSQTFKRLMDKDKTRIISRIFNKCSRRANFLKYRMGAFLNTHPLATPCWFDGTPNFFCNFTPSLKKVSSVFFSSVSEFLVHLENKLSFSTNQIHSFILLDDRCQRIKQQKKQIKKLSNSIVSISFIPSPESLPQTKHKYYRKKTQLDNLRLELFFKKKFPSLFDISKIQIKIEDSKREIKEYGLCHHERVIMIMKILKDIKSEFTQFEEERDKIKRENRLLLSFFKERLGLIQLEDPQLEESQKQSDLQFNHVSVITPNSMNIFWEDLLSEKDIQSEVPYLKSLKNRKHQELLEPHENKESENYSCSSKILELLHHIERENTSDNHPKKQTIDDLLNAEKVFFPQTLTDALELLRKEHQNFEIDNSCLQCHSLDAVHLSNIFPLNTRADYIMIPIAIWKNDSVEHYVMICIDKEEGGVEFYDSLGKEDHHYLLEHFSNAYFPNFPAKIKKSTVCAQYDAFLCGMYVYDFCKKRTQGMTFEEINQFPPMSIEVMGLKHQVIKELLKQKTQHRINVSQHIHWV